MIWTNMEVEADTLQQYADTWGRKNGYEVEVIHESPDVQQFAQAARSASGPDAIVGIPNDQLADYVNAGLAAEVPDGLYNDSDFSDAAIQACYVDGKRYAAPLSVETTGLLNIARRLQLYFSIEHALTITRSPLGGLKITLTLPRKQMPAPPKASK